MGRVVGELVRVVFSSDDATTGAPLGLYTEDGGARALAPHERLILRSLVIYGEPEAVGTVTVFNDADDDNAVDAGEEMAVVGEGTHDLHFGPEGMAGVVGILPHVIADGAGDVAITGVGYVVNGPDSGLVRPAWKG